MQLSHHDSLQDNQLDHFESQNFGQNFGVSFSLNNTGLERKSGISDDGENSQEAANHDLYSQECFQSSPIDTEVSPNNNQVEVDSAVRTECFECPAGIPSLPQNDQIAKYTGRKDIINKNLFRIVRRGLWALLQQQNDGDGKFIENWMVVVTTYIPYMLSFSYIWLISSKSIQNFRFITFVLKFRKYFEIS